MQSAFVYAESAQTSKLSQTLQAPWGPMRRRLKTYCVLPGIFSYLVLYFGMSQISCLVGNSPRLNQHQSLSYAGTDFLLD